jgi:hypothetical protein
LRRSGGAARRRARRRRCGRMCHAADEDRVLATIRTDLPTRKISSTFTSARCGSTLATSRSHGAHGYRHHIRPCPIRRTGSRKLCQSLNFDLPAASPHSAPAEAGDLCGYAPERGRRLYLADERSRLRYHCPCPSTPDGQHRPDHLGEGPTDEVPRPGRRSDQASPINDRASAGPTTRS